MPGTQNAKFAFRTRTYVLIVLGLIFLGLAVYYFVTPAGSLASFVPGTMLVRPTTTPNTGWPYWALPWCAGSALG